MSMRNHYRNLHDCAYWANMFEKTLVQEAINHPEKEEFIRNVLGKTKVNILDKAKSLESKAKSSLALNQHIKETKDKWLDKQKSK